MAFVAGRFANTLSSKIYINWSIFPDKENQKIKTNNIFIYLDFKHVLEVAIVRFKGVGWRHKYLAYVFGRDRLSRYITG